MISKENVDAVLKHVEKRLLDKVEMLMERANTPEEQKIISNTANELIQTVRQT